METFEARARGKIAISVFLGSLGRDCPGRPLSAIPLTPFCSSQLGVVLTGQLRASGAGEARQKGWARLALKAMAKTTWFC